MTLKYPTAWKLAEILPLLKEANHEIASIIALSPCFRFYKKNCDKAASNQFQSYLTKYERLTSHQSGNMKLHSTETLNILVTDVIFEAMDNKYLTVLILLKICRSSKIGRQRFIPCSMPMVPELSFGNNAICSDWHDRLRTASSQLYGVPQGALFYPLLFSIYTDELSSIPKTSSLESYVDDSKMFMSFHPQYFEPVENDLHDIAKWCCELSFSKS